MSKQPLPQMPRWDGPLSHPFYSHVVKRIIDFLFALILLIPGCIIMLPLAIWVKLDSPGPVLYKAVRGGYHNQPFYIYKFRSMVVGADKTGGCTALNDSRVTRAGKIMRRLKLDELPQLFNILKGDMSFVGPRPELLLYTTQYTKEQECILWVRPGITDRSSIVYIAQDEIVGTENPVENFEKYILPEKNRLRVEYASVVPAGCRTVLRDDWRRVRQGEEDGGRKARAGSKGAAEMSTSYTEKTHSAFHGAPIDTSDPKTLAWLIRRHGLEMTHISRGSHIGAIFSVAEIMAVLYTRILRVDPKNPQWENRDRLILSKGHAGASVYAALAERGFFPVEELSTHYANGSRLSGHVSHKGVPGVEFSTGSLGHGLSVAAGMALGGKKDNADWRVYCVLGDGECDEGSVWEAALQAHQFKLDNLVAIIDHNRMQSLDFCENTLALEPFGDKWRAFGWNVIETDGNDVDAVEKALRQAQENRGSGRPTVVIAVTTKGKGVSFMENDILWHYRTPQGEEYDAALAELEAQRP